MNSPSSILESINQLKNRMKHGKMELQCMKKGFPSTNNLIRNNSIININNNSFNQLNSLGFNKMETIEERLSQRPFSYKKQNQKNENQKENKEKCYDSQTKNQNQKKKLFGQNINFNNQNKQNICKKIPQGVITNQANQYKSQPNSFEDKMNKNKIIQLKRLHQKAILEIQERHSNLVSLMKQMFEKEKFQIKAQMQSKIDEQANYIMMLQQQLSPIQTQRGQQKQKQKQNLQKEINSRKRNQHRLQNKISQSITSNYSLQKSQQKYTQVVNRLLQQNTILLQQVQALKKVLHQRDRLQQRKSQMDKDRMKFGKMSRSNSIKSIGIPKSNHSHTGRQSETEREFRLSKQLKDSKEFRLTYSIDAENTNFLINNHNNQHKNSNFVQKQLIINNKSYHQQSMENNFKNRYQTNNEHYLYTKHYPEDSSQWIGSTPCDNQNLDNSNWRRFDSNEHKSPSKNKKHNRRYEYMFQNESDIKQWKQQQQESFDDCIQEQDIKLRTIRNFVSQKNMPSQKQIIHYQFKN